MVQGYIFVWKSPTPIENLKMFAFGYDTAIQNWVTLMFAFLTVLCLWLQIFIGLCKKHGSIYNSLLYSFSALCMSEKMDDGCALLRQFSIHFSMKNLSYCYNKCIWQSYFNNSRLFIEKQHKHCNIFVSRFTL